MDSHIQTSRRHFAAIFKSQQIILVQNIEIYLCKPKNDSQKNNLPKLILDGFITQNLFQCHFRCKRDLMIFGFLIHTGESLNNIGITPPPASPTQHTSNTPFLRWAPSGCIHIIIPCVFIIVEMQFHLTPICLLVHESVNCYQIQTRGRSSGP